MESFVKIGTPFSITVEPIKNDRGCWNYSKVIIFRNNIEIGSYIRHYPGGSDWTFLPFQVGEEWYCLYSDNYTKVKVAKLEDNFEHWCEGDLPSAFCPVDFYIPRYKTIESTPYEGKTEQIYLYDSYYSTEEEFTGDSDSDIFYENFGFLEGAYWAMSGNEIRFLDLKEIPNKILKITDRFKGQGIPQDDRKRLKDYIVMGDASSDQQYPKSVGILQAVYYDLDDLDNEV